jgi:hypothetical protein
MAPEPAGPPPRTAVGRGTCGPGARCLPAWSRRAPDPYPPRGQGPCAGATPGPAGWPARESAKFPAAACMAGGRAGRTATGRRIPGRPKRRVLRPPAPAVRRGLRPWTTTSGGTPSGSGRRRGGLGCRAGRGVFAPRPAGACRASGPGWRGPAAFAGLPLGLDLCWPGEESGAVGGSLVSAGCGATSGIGSGPRLSSGFAGWPPVRGKL